MAKTGQQNGKKKPRRGRGSQKPLELWTKEEHRRFLDALREHGRNWKEVAARVGTRTVNQVVGHARRYGERCEREERPDHRKATPRLPKANKNNAERAADEGSDRDVLYLRGAAAQTVAHPGNLNFYRLCEERYDEFSTCEGGIKDGRLRAICDEIVDAVAASGGVFRGGDGRALERRDALRKTRDRLRQIGRPKLRPNAGRFGAHDVVFGGIGAENFLYPGNARWRELLVRYVPRYFRINEDGSIVDDWRGIPMKGWSPPQHKLDAIAEMVRNVHERGGKFRDRDMNELSAEEVLEKTKLQFRDVKKDYIAGKIPLVAGAASASNGIARGKGEDDPGETAGNAVDESVSWTSKILHGRMNGFTSARNVVPTSKKPKSKKSGNDGLNSMPRVGKWLQDKEREDRVRRRQERSNRRLDRWLLSTGRKGAIRAKPYNRDDGDDDDSFRSEMLESDTDSEKDGDEDEDDPNSAPRVDKRVQDRRREDRVRRREERGRRSSDRRRPLPSEPRKGTKRKRRSERGEGEESNCPSEEEEEGDAREHPLSEYELYRLEKIKRNKAKLADLGLL